MEENGYLKQTPPGAQARPDETPPPNLRDFVRVYDEALPGAVCDDIVERFEADAERHFRRRMRNIRSFTELNIEEVPEWRETLRSLEESAEEYYGRYRKESVGVFPVHREFESFRIKRYLPDEGDVFSRHADGYDAATAMRYMVFFWYLNDVDEGGETWFPALRMRVRPRRGRLLMFPPFWMFEHAGLKPVSGPKYILGSYLRFPEPRD